MSLEIGRFVDASHDTAGELVCQAQNGVVFALNTSTLFDFANRVIHLGQILIGSSHLSPEWTHFEYAVPDL